MCVYTSKLITWCWLWVSTCDLRFPWQCTMKGIDANHRGPHSSWTLPKNWELLLLSGPCFCSWPPRGCQLVFNSYCGLMRKLASKFRFLQQGAEWPTKPTRGCLHTSGYGPAWSSVTVNTTRCHLLFICMFLSLLHLNFNLVNKYITAISKTVNIYVYICTIIIIIPKIMWACTGIRNFSCKTCVLLQYIKN